MRVALRTHELCPGAHAHAEARRMSLPVEHRLAHLCGRGLRPTAATAISGGSRTQAGNKDAGLGKAAGEAVGTRHPGGEGRERPSAPGGRPGATGGKGTGGWQGSCAGGDRGCSRQNKQVGVGLKAGLKAKESDKEKEKNIKSRENEKITPPKGEEGRGRLLRRGWGRQE